MSDPTTIRELNIIVQDFKEFVRTQFTNFKDHADTRFNVLLWMLGLIVATMLTELAGGWALFKDVAGIKADVAELKGEVKGAAGQFAKLDPQPLQLALAELNTRLQALAPISAPTPSPPLMLGEKERQLIRQFVGGSPVPGAKSLPQVGDTIPDRLALEPFRNSLLNQVHSLIGTRYAIDPNSGSILVVANRDNRIVAIVE